MKIYGDENNVFIQKELGHRLKDIRIRQGMTQKELANNSGVALSTVIRLENGEGCNLDNLIKIMRILGIVKNFNMLIPEQEVIPSDILYKKSKPKRVYKSKKEEILPWIWGEDEEK